MPFFKYRDKETGVFHSRVFSGSEEVALYNARENEECVEVTPDQNQNPAYAAIEKLRLDRKKREREAP